MRDTQRERERERYTKTQRERERERYTKTQRERLNGQSGKSTFVAI